MIPKIINHIVGPKTNFAIDKCLKSWEVLRNHGFAIEIWNDEIIETFIATNYPFALEAFKNARNHGEAADIARYLIVNHSGGHWIDWDVQLLDPEGFLFICKENTNGYFIVDPVNETLAAEVFASTPNNPYLLQLSKDIVQLYENDLRNSMGTPQYSGPYRMRDSLKKFGEIAQTIIPVKEMFAYDYSEIQAMEKREITQPMIHYWLHSWLN